MTITVPRGLRRSRVTVNGRRVAVRRRGRRLTISFAGRPRGRVTRPRRRHARPPLPPLHGEAVTTSCEFEGSATW